MNTIIIAEIGWNFMGDLELASKMIKSAAKCGANRVKFQYWQEKSLIPGPWDTDGRREIYKSAQLNKESVLKLISICQDAKVNFLISIFNIHDAKEMIEIGCNSIKIPSHEVANLKLHEFAANNFNEIFVSLGAGSWSELQQAAKIYQKYKSNWFAMHCVSSYPCPIKSINLGKLDHFNWQVPIGLSDHTQSEIVPALSVIKGCQVIEKHFTSDKDLPGRDNKFALDEKEFERMVKNIREAEIAKNFLGLEAQSIEADTINKYRGRWG